MKLIQVRFIFHYVFLSKFFMKWIWSLVYQLKYFFSVSPITSRKSLYKVDKLNAKKTDSGIHFSICLHYIIDWYWWIKRRHRSIHVQKAFEYLILVKKSALMFVKLKIVVNYSSTNNTWKEIIQDWYTLLKEGWFRYTF